MNEYKESRRQSSHAYAPPRGIWVAKFLANNLKDNCGVDIIIVKKQLCQLLNTNREFFPSFDGSNFHKLVDKSS